MWNRWTQLINSEFELDGLGTWLRLVDCESVSISGHGRKNLTDRYGGFPNVYSPGFRQSASRSHRSSGDSLSDHCDQM